MTVNMRGQYRAELRQLDRQRLAILKRRKTLTVQHYDAREQLDREFIATMERTDREIGRIDRRRGILQGRLA